MPICCGVEMNQSPETGEWECEVCGGVIDDCPSLYPGPGSSFTRKHGPYTWSDGNPDDFGDH